MLKVLINEEEVIANQNFTINKHMLNTPSVILNNVCPKEWKENRNYSGFYHPLDYSKCKILDVPTEEEKIGQYQKITNSGTITNVDSTKENEITQLDGNTTQEATPTPSSPQPINVVSGRQEVEIWKKNRINLKNGTYISNREELTAIVEDNVVKVSGTTTAGSNTIFIPLETPITLKVGETNTFWGKVQSGTAPASNISLRLLTTNSSSNGNSFGGTYVSTARTLVATQTEQQTFTYVLFYLSNNQTINCDFVYQLELGSKTISEVSYEKYDGKSYEINLGKNLFNINGGRTDSSCASLVSNNTLTQTNRGAYCRTIWKIDNLVVGQKYTLNYDYINENGSSIQVRTYRADNSTQINGSSVSTATSGNQFVTFTPLDTTCYLRFYSNTTGTSNTYTVFYKNIQLEKGSVASPYSVYKTPIELCKIENYQDFIKKGTGKNLFDKDNLETLSNYYVDNTGKIVAGSYNKFNWVKLEPNTTYTLTQSIVSNVARRIALFDSIPVANLTGTLLGTFTGTTPINQTFTTTSTNVYLGWVYCNTNNLAGHTEQEMLDSIQIEKGQATSYEPYGMYNKWYIEKQIGKVVLDGSESWWYSSQTHPVFYLTDGVEKYSSSDFIPYCNNYLGKSKVNNASGIASLGNNVIAFLIGNTTNRFFLTDDRYTADSTGLAQFKSWLSSNNMILYYVLATPTYTEITDSELIGQLNSVKLIEGLNNISITSPYLSTSITFHYNYWLDKLLFCGVVKNSGNISLNPREPHYSSLQILDFKTFLSEGETLDYVIYQKTILEAIQQVIDSISDYGFVLGNVNILNPDDIIGAYSTKDKTAYDVFNYIADITQSRWTTRMINENQVAIDFYDPTLMPEGAEIDYTDTFFKNNLIDDISYNYGTNNYRNKQVMISNQVVGNLAQIQTFTSNGYQDQYIVDLPVAEIQNVYVDGEEKTFASHQEYQLGINADFYYTINSNIIESENILDASSRIEIYYIPIIEGRQVIVNEDEISRINTSTGRKGIVSRYEQRNDATTSLELQKIGESYIKYKGTPEIVLTIQSRTNIWEVGERVQFNAPIDELDTTYMVRTKKINYIASQNTLFYTYELVSSFNSETEINYFDNQRAKSKGNIGDGEYISRNIDIENTANIIFYDTTTTEITPVGDNVLESVLNSPFTN